MGTVRDTATANPAFFRVFQNGRLSFFGISDESVAHADFDTPAASVAGILIEINMVESHASLPKKFLFVC